MQNPVGASLITNHAHGISSFADLLLNRPAQVKFCPYRCRRLYHGLCFRAGISAYYMLKGRDAAFAQRSLPSPQDLVWQPFCRVIVLGDESGYTSGEVQKNQTGRYLRPNGIP